MAERTVLFGGRPLALAGPALQVGDPAPNFRLVDTSLQERQLSDWAGKIRVLSVVPSLDTPVCDQQTRRFNQTLNQSGSDVVVLTVSMDLPFAQARWCGNSGLEQVITLSDHRDAAFGIAYGTLIPALRLESRAVFVVDPEDRLRYVEYVPELAQHPNYAAVEAAVAALRR
ncbi:MAG: thiol peroxidase [Firmicutes bacterium]|nr:thiol peroxidase [Alicyclobacillaceae bacterium]MCL6497995.1 thiol peroxidase [Bacillota bacterium]